MNGEVPELTGPQAASLARQLNNNVKNSAKAHMEKQREEQCREKTEVISS